MDSWADVPQAFTTWSEEKSSRPDTAFYYQEMEDITEFIRWMSKEVCNSDTVCQSRAQDLSRASSLDISWDSAEGMLRVSSHVPVSQQEIAATGSSKRRTEVGVLSKDVPLKPQPHEIALSGALSVLGESKDPSATLFSFPARHRLSDASFSADFVSPAGLHPTLRLALSSSKPPAEGGSRCSPFAYFTFPKTIFADRYQFADELFLASKNLTASRYTTLPVDLEAPVYTTETWGSNVLLELAPPGAASQEWTAEVPLHLRYLRPTQSGKMDIEIPYPAVFWACEAEAGTDFSVNPFDRTHVGYDALFEDVVFWHLKPQPVQGNIIMSAISVPVLQQQAAPWVQQGTAAAVLVGFLWVLWKLFGALTTHRAQSGKGKARQNCSSKRKTK